MLYPVGDRKVTGPAGRSVPKHSYSTSSTSPDHHPFLTSSNILVLPPQRLDVSVQSEAGILNRLSCLLLSLLRTLVLQGAYLLYI
jgi:hypothetical protein